MVAQLILLTARMHCILRHHFASGHSNFLRCEMKIIVLIKSPLLQGSLMIKQKVLKKSTEKSRGKVESPGPLCPPSLAWDTDEALC